MLIQQTHYPLQGNSFPWGTVAVAVLLVAGTGYLTYQAFKTPKPIANNKTIKNERGSLS